MHPNTTFRKAERQLNLDFSKSRGFGTLAINADNGPLLSHIPFLVSEDGNTLEAHLVRSNPILKQIGEGVEAVISITGPDSYVSPDWYKIENQVPTWNYIAVHLRGKLTRLPDNELTGIIARLSDHFESRLLPKPVWKMEKMDALPLEKMKRMIVPIAMKITDINGTWKLAQNKPDDVRLAAAVEVRQHGIGSQVEELAALMNEPPC